MKKTSLALILALCLILQAAPGFAFGPSNLVAGNTADEKIVPFLDLSWEEVQADPEGCRRVYFGCVSDYGIVYDITLYTVQTGGVGGVIESRDDDFSTLVSLWKELGIKLMEQFGNPEEIEGLEDSVACYQFVDEKAYVRYELMYKDYGSFISFVVNRK